MFFYTSDLDDPLIARKSETTDNVIPSSNSSMAKALLLLGHYYGDEDYLHISRQQMMNMKDLVMAHPAFYSNWAMLMDRYISEPYEVAIVGPQAAAMAKEFNVHYLPAVIWSGAMQQSALPLLMDKVKTDETLIYICRNKTCGLPMISVSEALKWME
jgi:uncharacterized protein YyaL (SSP411 family)